MSQNRTQHEETHLRVLRLLEKNPKLTQRELSEALGVSLGKANYCLNALIAQGSIKIHNFRKCDQKSSYIYLLTPAGVIEKAQLTSRFLKQKMTEYENLKSEIEILQKELANIESN